MKRRRRYAAHAHLPPGTLPPAAPDGAPAATITRLEYTAERVEERACIGVEEALAGSGVHGTTWINVDGLHRPEVVERLGRHFGLHRLLLEDVLHVGQRPKLEDYDSHLFLELDAVRLDDGAGEVAFEQVSLVLAERWVLTFNERAQRFVEVIRERLRSNHGQIRHRGADYLAYSILDAAVDGYFLVLERLGDRIEAVEENLVARPEPRTLQEVYRLKREILHLRKSLWPLREVAGALGRAPAHVRPETAPYLRDLYDHVAQALDTVETYRDVIAGMLEMYLSSVSNRMNEVMKVLTVIATIFIPLTFVAGIYGMNFRAMPELEWRFGYPAVLGAMAALGLGMALYFKRKKWF